MREGYYLGKKADKTHWKDKDKNVYALFSWHSWEACSLLKRRGGDLGERAGQLEWEKGKLQWGAM